MGKGKKRTTREDGKGDTGKKGSLRNEKKVMEMGIKWHVDGGKVGNERVRGKIMDD